MTRVADMTREELRNLISEVVAEQLARRNGATAAGPRSAAQEKRTWAEVLDEIERRRWTPPPGAPSSQEILRAHRDGLCSAGATKPDNAE